MERKKNDTIQSPESLELALKRFSILSGLVQYEGSVLWSRSQLYLVANAALLGFISTRLPSVDLGGILWAQIYTVLGVSLGGLSLAVFWMQSLKSSDHYLDHWLEVAREIEPDAFKDTEVFKYRPSDTSARQMARWTSRLFILMWVLVCAFLLACILLKCTGWKLP
jgi:hypothetical protein